LNSIKRQIVNPAEECSADKLGRALIPSSLRLHAELERDIWFVGMGQRFDIWSKGTYSRINTQDEKNFPLDSEALAAMGV
jgi:MraZ protein